MECRTCGIDKELSAFHRNKSKKSGYHDSCKECRKEETKQYRESHPEEVKISKRNWEISENGKASKAQYRERKRKENGEEIRKYHRDYHHANREQLLPKKRAYYENNREALIAKSIESQRRNPQKARERAKRFYERHTELC